MHILKIEWMKLRFYRTFWILLSIVAISIPAFNYVVYDFLNTKLKLNGQNLLGNPFALPDSWQTIGYFAGSLFLIPGILIITLLTNEFSFKTNRQNIIDGLSRNQFIYVKLLEVLILSLFTTGVVFFTAFGFGKFSNHTSSPNSFDWQYLRFVFFYFVQMVSYSLIAFLIALFVKRAGLAMGIFFIYMLIEQFIVVLMREKYKFTVANYLPEEVTDRLIPLPFGRRMMSAADLKIWENHVPGYLSIASCYIVLYCFFIIWRFRKADL
jgi:ABC-2 type transport system permease protein